MEYIKVSQAAEKWGLSPRRVRLLCAQNRIDGVVQKGKLYTIPENAPKPVDARTLTATADQYIRLSLSRIFLSFTMSIYLLLQKSA